MSRLNSNQFSRRMLLKGFGASALTLSSGNARGLDINHTDGEPRSKAQSQPKIAFVISKQHPTIIVIPRDKEPLILLAVERLADYIRRATGSQPKIYATGDPAALSQETSAIIFQKRHLPYFRSDGYRITVSPEKNRAVASIFAPGAAGLKYGSYRLIREMQQQGRELHVPELSLEANPWLKTRELFIADLDWRSATASEKKILPELQKKFDWPNWDISRLERYVDLMDAMGYNSLMLTDPHKLVAFSGGFASSIEEITGKVEAMYRRARKNGMGTALFLWGQEGTRTIAHDYQITSNNPRVAAELDDIKAHWESVIERFGPLVDRWLLHWADPGGCKTLDCSINTPQVLTNQFADLLRRRGFNSDVSFSLWALRWGNSPQSRPWPGYIDWTSVVDSGVLSPEVGIGMMRHYNYEQAKAITNQHRKAGVWGWYLNDVETSPGLHVHGHILEDEFRRVDPSASAFLDWYSLEDNNHCLNPPTIYAGAQMLWDTGTRASQAILDFCDAVWGPSRALRVAQALEAIGKVRCGPGQYILAENLWPDDYMCWSGKGSSSPLSDLSSCEKALQGLASVEIDPDYVPKLPLIVKPTELLDNVRSHLTYIRDFARIRVAYQRALEPAWEEGRLEDTQQRMNSIPTLPDSIPGVYGAAQETFYDRLLRKFIDTWKGRTFNDNLALDKKATASSCFNDDSRFAPENAVNGILCEFTEEGWAAGASGPAWLKIDLGKAEMIKKVRIYNRGYRRELFDNNLVATPAKADVFYALEDLNPAQGIIEGPEPDYKLMGGFKGWAPTDDPGAFQEITAQNPVRARFVKIVIYSAANKQAVGCGEVEIRRE